MAFLSNDLRVARRRLLRSPAHSLTSVVVLGLGLGAAVSTFAVTRSVLLQPLPVVDQDRLVLPKTRDPRGVDLAITVNDLKAVRASSRTMSAIAAYAHQGAFELPVIDGDRTVAMRAAWVTGNFFDVLGTRPALGRFFHADDESETDAKAVVLSYGSWKRYFGGDSAVVGRTLGNPYLPTRYTIVGIAPAGLDFPSGAEYWTPHVYVGGLDILGRLAPAASPDAARDEFLRTMREQYRTGSGRDVNSLAAGTVQTLTVAVLGDVRPVLRLLMAAVLLLFLLACINVGTLQLLQTAGRRREIAVRRSLGAGATAIVRLLLTESGALIVVGGALGYGLSRGLIAWLVRVRPVGLPRTDLLAPAPIWMTVVGVLGVALLVWPLSGLAVRHRRVLSTQLGDRSGHSTVATRRAREWFVGAQVALALVMLSGAGLLLRSLANLESIDLGYRPHHLSLISVALPVSGITDKEDPFAPLLAGLPTAFHGVPGITGVTPLDAPPFFGPQIFNGQWVADGQSGTNNHIRIPVEAGGAEYFTTMGIPVLTGRGFLTSDQKEAPYVAVVSLSAAKLLGLGANPLGRRIRFADDTGTRSWRTIVGVIGDIRYRSLREATPTIVLPASQFFFQGFLAVRSTTPLSSVLPGLRRAVRDVNPAASITRAQPMDDLLRSQRSVSRFSTLLLSGIGVVAITMAAIGLYGLLASIVRETRKDIGIRMALGATPGRVGRETLTQALAVVGPGVLVGVVVSVFASNLVASLLYGTSPTDAAALGGAAALLLTVSLLAAYVPTRRAASVDPAEVLKAD